MVEKYIMHYNNVRLHSSIGYIAPQDKLEGREQLIFKERDRKLEEARELRRQKRQRAFSEINTKEEAELPLMPPQNRLTPFDA